MIRVFLIVLITCIVCPPVARAQQPLKGTDPQSQEKESPDKEKLSHRDALLKRVQEFKKAGKYEEAISVTNQVLAIEREVFGESHEEVVGTLIFLAGLYEQLDQLPDAEKLLREILDIQTKQFGKDHWMVIDARLNLAKTRLLSKLTLAEREELRRAYGLEQEIIKLFRQSKYEQAVSVAMESARKFRKFLGESHPDYAKSLNILAVIYKSMGKYVKAEQVYRKAVVILERTLGKAHPDYATSLNNLAVLNKSMGDYTEAERLYREALSIREKTLGKSHPDYARSLIDLGVLYRSMGNYVKAEQLLREAMAIIEKTLDKSHPDYARSLNDLACLYYSKGEYVKAEPLYREAMAITEQTLGKSHPDYAASQNNLASLYKSMGDYVKAEQLYREAMAIKEKTLGKAHPSYAAILNNLAALYKSMGDFAKADPMYREAMALMEKTLGKSHPSYATNLNNLAALYKSKGDYIKAEKLHRKAIAIREQILGKSHPDYATSLCNLVDLYRSIGDYAKAEPLCREAIAIREQSLGKSHPDYALSLYNLAWMYESMGDYEKVESLYHKAIAIIEKKFGKQHPDYATILNNLAALYKSMGDYAKAEKLFQETMAIKEKALGKSHPYYAMVLNNLAALYISMGDFAKAEPLFQEAIATIEQTLGKSHRDYAMSLQNLAGLYYFMCDHVKAEPLYCETITIIKQTLGKSHPDYAMSLSNLAQLYGRIGDYAKAEPRLNEANRIMRHHFFSTLAVQSERQQLARMVDVRKYLDRWLSTPVKVAAKEVFEEVNAWKGAVWAAQQGARQMRRMIKALGDDDALQLFNRLDLASRSCAKFILSRPEFKGTVEQYEEQLKKLTEAKEKLEKQLAGRYEAFRRLKKQEKQTGDDLRAALPEKTVLIDMLEYDHSSPPAGKGKQWTCERRLLALVVSRTRETVRVDLGPVKPITEAVDKWRISYGRRDPTRIDHPGKQLRRLVWDRLASHFGDAEVVLISPDGALSRFPFAALPGSKPGSYLIEEGPLVSAVAVSRLLPQLLSGRETRGIPSLVVVGDVDYNADVGASGTAGWHAPSHGGLFGSWDHLNATCPEMLAVRELFEQRWKKGEVMTLRNAMATESVVRKAMPGQRYLHFATHGFFADAKLRSVLATTAVKREPGFRPRERIDVVGYHPGVLSGLVLAGANLPADPNRDDGYLTAMEVSELDLSGVDLAVLSACETGLGKTAGGEGLLGLQRAFQIAGAKSVVAGLWKVADDPTRALMTAFYENLWKNGLPKLDALRQAQLMMLRGGASRSKKKSPPSVQGKRPDKGGSDEAKRGLSWPKGRGSDKSGRLPPYYWAGFVLSGDWR